MKFVNEFRDKKEKRELLGSRFWFNYFLLNRLYATNSFVSWVAKVIIGVKAGRISFHFYAVYNETVYNKQSQKSIRSFIERPVALARNYFRRNLGH